MFVEPVYISNAVTTNSDLTQRNRTITKVLGKLLIVLNEPIYCCFHNSSARIHAGLELGEWHWRILPASKTIHHDVRGIQLFRIQASKAFDAWT